MATRAHFTFDGETGALIAQRQVAVRDEDNNEDLLAGEARIALTNLRTTVNSNGTLTGAQLSNGVRLLARCMIVVIRLLVRSLEDVT